VADYSGATKGREGGADVIERTLPTPTLRAIRTKLADKQMWKCAYCGCRMTEADGVSPSSVTLEHIVPLALGGRDRFDNYCACCLKCNNDKGDDLPEYTLTPKPKRKAKKRKAKPRSDAQIQTDRAARKAFARRELGCRA
jgi:5-methylcytosine-specific restriction endonuclease McrA